MPPIDTSNSETGKISKVPMPPYHTLALTVLPFFAACLALMAMINLQSGDTIGDYAKAALVATAAGLVSYCINRFAIDWGAELTANGFITAGVFSVFSILSVGVCLWAFTYAGMVLPDVRQLRLEDHNQALVLYIDEHNQKTSAAMRVSPVIKAASSDLTYHAACELKSSCVSGRGNGGAGPVSRFLHEKSIRAEAIATQLSEGELLRTTTIANLNKLVGRYQEVLSNNDKSIKERRKALAKIDSDIGQAITTLEESLPIALLAAYVDELTVGVTIPNRPIASQNVNSLLAKHGNAIKSVLATLDGKAVIRPTLPARAGIADTFSYIGHFAAIAGVIWVAEGIFPLALWIYTLLFLIRHQQLGGRPDAPMARSSERFVDEVNGSDDGSEIATLSHRRQRRRGSSNRSRGA